jgi:hypothetical protein
MERRDGDRIAAADAESTTIPQVKRAEHEASGEIQGRVALMLALVTVGVVDFHPGPKFLEEFIRKPVVP